MTSRESADSIASAFDRAVEELELGDSGDDETPLPGVESQSTELDEQAAEGAEEQPEVDADEVGDELLDLLMEEESDEAEGDALADVEDPEFWEDVELEVELDGELETFTLEELIEELEEGALRQSDYTRKTQEVAEQRKFNEDAIGFYEQLAANPLGVLKQIVDEVGGWEAISGADATSGDLPQIMSPDEIEAEVQRRVAERLDEDPTLNLARAREAEAMMMDSFAEIEDAYGVELSSANMELIVDAAAEMGSTDLFGVYSRLRQEAQARMAESDRLKANSSVRKRSGGAPPVAEEVEVNSIRDAFELAMAERETRQVA